MDLVLIAMGLGCSILWGIGFYALLSLAKIRPEVILVLQSSCMVIGGCIIMVARSSYKDLSGLDRSLFGTLSLYLVTTVIAAFLSLWGYQLATAKTTGAYTAIASTYPMVLLLLVIIFVGTSELNLIKSVTGVVLTTIGVIVLSV